MDNVCSCGGRSEVTLAVLRGLVGVQLGAGRREEEEEEEEEGGSL